MIGLETAWQERCGAARAQWGVKMLLGGDARCPGLAAPSSETNKLELKEEDGFNFCGVDGEFWCELFPRLA